MTTTIQAAANGNPIAPQGLFYLDAPPAVVGNAWTELLMDSTGVTSDDVTLVGGRIRFGVEGKYLVVMRLWIQAAGAPVVGKVGLSWGGDASVNGMASFLPYPAGSDYYVTVTDTNHQLVGDEVTIWYYYGCGGVPTFNPGFCGFSVQRLSEFP